MKDNTTVTVMKSTKRVVELSAEEVENILLAHFALIHYPVEIFWEYDISKDTVTGVVLKQEVYEEETQ